MHYPADPNIPTLTRRADVPQRAEPQPPVLTQLANDAAPLAASMTHRSVHLADPLRDAAATDLRAQLRTELERVTQKAMDEAMAGLRARLETELPALIERVLCNQANTESASPDL